MMIRCLQFIPALKSLNRGASAAALLFWLLSFLPVFSAGAATYYADPSTGSMGNPGSSAKPWSTLEAVFAAGRTFLPGDVILLRTGYHGFPQIRGLNTGAVTVKPDTGAAPALRKLLVGKASKWVIEGLDICPANAGGTVYDTGSLVTVESDCSGITIRGCSISGARDTSGWAEQDWAPRLGTGLSIKGAGSSIAGNSLLNVKFGISVAKTATGAVVSRNTIENFSNDGIRALADGCVYEYNTVKNCHTHDSNHDDAFQSWSTDARGVVGKGTVSGVTVRGNMFISWTDPNQPFKSHMQGMGLFDGMFANWVVENNLVVSDTWHGIAFYGAKNCRIVNNTVVENPISSGFANVPWILVTKHKNGAASSGNLIRNNLTTKVTFDAGSAVADHNIKTRAYGGFFTDYAGFDFTLLPASVAVGAGLQTGAPAIDIDERARNLPCDVGAYEYTEGAE